MPVQMSLQNQKQTHSSHFTLTNPANAELSFLSFLQSEFLVLSNECKKKYPEIKTSLDGVFIELKRIKDLIQQQSEENTSQVCYLKELAKDDLIVKPLIMSMETNVPRLLAIAGNIAQRMCINYECLCLDCIEDILDILETMAVSSMNEELQLKSLQSMMPLVTGLLEYLHGKLLQHAYWIVFKLLESKFATIRNTALAVLRQLIIILFEKISFDERTQGVINGESLAEAEMKIKQSPHFEDALVIFDDICSSYNDEETKVFVGLRALNKLHALELIESIIMNVTIFKNHPETILILKEKVCTMLVKRLDTSDFGENALLWRITGLLLHNYYSLMKIEGEIFVSFAIRILDDQEVETWKKILAAEVLKGLLLDPSLVEQFYFLSQEKDRPISLVDILECLKRSVLNNLSSVNASENSGKKSPKPEEITFEGSQAKVPFLSQFDKSKPPHIPAYNLAFLGFQSVQGLLQIITKSDREIWGRMVQSSWSIMLVTIEGIFMCTNLDFKWQEELIATYKTMSIIATKFGVKEALNASLEQQVGFIKKGIGLSDMTFLSLAKNVIQTACEIPSCLGKNWILVFQVVQWVDVYTLNKSKKLSPLPTSPQAGKKSASTQNVSSAMSLPDDQGKDMIGDLAECVRALLDLQVTDDAFVEMLKALIAVIKDTIAKDPAFSLLPIQKLKQLTLPNCSRLDKIWYTLSECLMSLVANEEINNRALGMEIFCLVIQQMVTIPSDDQTQTLIMSSLLKSIQVTNFTDIRQSCLECLCKVVMNHGESLRSAWEPLLLILIHILGVVRTGTDDLDLSMLKSVFAIIGHIAEDYRRTFSQKALSLYIKSLGVCASSPLDLNIALTAVGFLWDVADHVLSEVKDPYLLWLLVLETFYGLADDSRSEVRNSAITSLFRAISEVHSLTEQQWTHLYTGITIPILEGLCSKQIPPIADVVPPSIEVEGEATSSDPTQGLADKQYNETMVLAFTGSVKVLKSHFDILTTSNLVDFSFKKSFLDILRNYCQSGRAEQINVAMCEGLEVCSIKLEFKLQKMLLNAIEPIILTCHNWEQTSLTKFIKVYIALNDQKPKGGLADLEFYRQWLDALEVVIYVPYTPIDRGNDRDCLNELQKIIWKFCEVIMRPGENKLMRLACILFTCNVLEKVISKKGNELEFPSLIAFCFQVLEKLPVWLQNDQKNGLFEEAYESIKKILEVVGTWMQAKYSAPSGKLGQAWVAAFKTFSEIISTLDFSIFTDWDTLVAVIEGALDTVHFIPDDIEAQQLEADELVDISFIKALQTRIVPNIPNEHIAQQIFTKLEKCSRFVNIWEPLPQSTLQRSLWEATPIPKAALANACLQMLFDCGCGTVAASSSVRQVALNSLLRRCRKVLLNYARIGKYYWQEFPQIVLEEVYYTLDKLLNSRLQKMDHAGGSTDHLWTLSDLLLEFVYYTSRFTNTPIIAAKLGGQPGQMGNGNDLRTAVSSKAKAILDLLLGEVRDQKGIKDLMGGKSTINEIDYNAAKDPDAYF